VSTALPLSILPAPYDIVWCRFPEHDDLGNPGPKPRPGIVMNVAVDDDERTGEVQVIYGTTTLKMQTRRHDFFVCKLSEMEMCGLDKATRFDLDTFAWIPWDSEWFDTLPQYDSPIVGHLTDHAIKLLQIELSYRKAAQMRALAERTRGDAD